MADRVELSRTYWHAKGVGGSVPVDRLLDAAAATVSVGVCELACRLNACTRNFDRAAENLGRAAGVKMSGELLRQIVEQEGRAVLAAAESHQLPAGWSAEDCRIGGGGGEGGDATRVYAGADGVMAPTITQAEKDARRKAVKARRRKAGKKLRPLPPAREGADQRYKEFKIVVYYDQEQAHRSVSVTRGDCGVAGAIMRRDACRINLSRADDTAGLFDGAEWIRNQVGRVCLNLKAVGLDFYHLAENVHKCRKAVFGEENPAGRQWAGEVLHTVKHEGYEPFRARLEELRTRVGRSRAKRAAADRLIEYAEHRREMIAYPEFLAAGRHIGSGPTESMCKAVTLRLKGSGMRWDADNAEAVVALEALYQSGQWNAWWILRLKPAI